MLYGTIIIYCCYLLFFFFKQKTAYEMRISDWSSDVCSSDLRQAAADRRRANGDGHRCARREGLCHRHAGALEAAPGTGQPARGGRRLPGDQAYAGPRGVRRTRTRRKDRKSVESGKSVRVRVDIGARSISQKNKT